MFALILLAAAALSAIGLGVGFPYLEAKWNQITGDRSERKLLKGLAEVEVQEIEEEWETTPEELAEIEAELEKEMSEW